MLQCFMQQVKNGYTYADDIRVSETYPMLPVNTSDPTDVHGMQQPDQAGQSSAMVLFLLHSGPIRSSCTCYFRRCGHWANFVGILLQIHLSLA